MASLMDRQRGIWRVPLDVVPNISVMYEAKKDCQDVLFWEPAKDGRFLVKSDYILFAISV